MAAQHTPGPWAVHPQRAYVVPEDHVERPIGGADDVEFDARHYAQEICALHWPDPHRSEAEVRANARLIAAAPDLLALLKQALVFIEADTAPCGPGEVVGEISVQDLKTGLRHEIDLWAVRDAITAAEGR